MNTKRGGTCVSPRFVASGILLGSLAQEDVKQEAYYHKNQGTYLYSIVVVPAKEIAADEQDSTENYDDGSQILFKAVHCYVVLFVSSLTAK